MSDDVPTCPGCSSKLCPDCNPRFRKSSFSAQYECVEARVKAGMVEVRDSKNPDGPTLRFSFAEWEAFTAGIQAGEFDRLGQGA